LWGSQCLTINFPIEERGAGKKGIHKPAGCCSWNRENKMTRFLDIDISEDLRPDAALDVGIKICRGNFAARLKTISTTM
jgi:hypothetical protein